MRITNLKPRIETQSTSLPIAGLGDTERIRGTTLQNIRAAHFALHPLCAYCLKKDPPRTSVATQLDHKTPLHLGGTETEENRQGLCDECHLEKSKNERGHAYIPKGKR